MSDFSLSVGSNHAEIYQKETLRDSDLRTKISKLYAYIITIKNYGAYMENTRSH